MNKSANPACNKKTHIVIEPSPMSRKRNTLAVPYNIIQQAVIILL